MPNQRISAFTCVANGRANSLISNVGVSAHKNLFPEAQLNNYVAIWDTGATNTAISQKVAEQCNLIPTGQAISNTANGQCTVNTYLIDLYLPNNVIIGGVKATEFNSVGGSDLLIGMDIISLGDFAVSNFEGKTAFSFRFPSISKTDYVEQLNLRNPVKNSSVKIGRNTPCPCGSGRKYKQCCGK